jgi:hypothetical protein
VRFSLRLKKDLVKDMNEMVKISAKMLGELMLPSFCPRCFWVRMKCQNHLPYQKFAGISMIIDSFTKKIVHSYFEKHMKAPPFFHPFGELTRTVPVPHHTKFYFDDKDTAIRLTGTPDDIFLRDDSAFVIADYETAKLNENQTAILPLYEVQLNCYALIAEENGFNPVEQLGLIYFEPQTILESDIAAGQMNEGFRLSFKAKFLEVKLNPHRIIPPLLKQARQLTDLAELPSSREGCKDCQMINELTRWVS